MRKISADYVFPISKEPVKNGVLITEDNGKIINMIDPKSLDYELSDVEEYKGFICPGFVNSHCHLELSYLKDKIKMHIGLDDFLYFLSEERGHSLQTSASKNLRTTVIPEAIESAEKEMLRNGIVAVGDVVNSDVTFGAKKNSKLRYHNFIELFGSNPKSANKVFDEGVKLFEKFYELTNSSLVPHSSYSVSEKLFQKIKQFARETNGILTMHHQESEEENKYFSDKSGKIVERYAKMGIDFSAFKPTGLRPLVSVSGFLPSKNHLQLVHNTYADEEDIEYAENKFRDLWWCLCPNSNLYIEDKLPEINLFADNKCKITIGTDSLASNLELSILSELQTINWNYPQIEFSELLKWATLNGAKFMNMEDKYGSFDKGKMPGIILIEHVDSGKMQLLNKSKIKVIVFSH